MKTKLQTGILFIATLFALSSCSQKTKETKKDNKQPNIVFIMADDHAVAAISAYEDWLAEIAPTPNIDRIANNGMLMHNTYNTNSICGPSRSAILTGKYGHVSGFFKNEKGSCYSKTNYTNEWFGQTDDGDELPVGTYFYTMEYQNGKRRTAWVYIQREN